MKKLLLGVLLAAFALPALAQTTTGPTSCKANEMWDEATKSCKAK